MGNQKSKYIFKEYKQFSTVSVKMTYYVIHSFRRKRKLIFNTCHQSALLNLYNHIEPQLSGLHGNDDDHVIFFYAWIELVSMLMQKISQEWLHVQKVKPL